MSRHVAVLMGGLSNERQMSLASGAAVSAALRRGGYRVTEIDAGHDLASRLAAVAPDVAFNALHGGMGSNGQVQGLLEVLGIAYTHSGVLASAIGSDKHQAKIMFKMAGIPVTDHVLVSRGEAARVHVMPPPYVIKPVADGSGFGVHIVRGNAELPPQTILDEDWAWGDTVMVERYIPGRDLSCAVMGDVALAVSEVVTDPVVADGGIGVQDVIIPARLQPKIYDKVQKLSLAAHAALGCRGVTRCDFRYNEAAGEDGELVCLEIDTQPGIGEASIVAGQVAHVGHGYDQMITWMVEDASCNR